MPGFFNRRKKQSAPEKSAKAPLRSGEGKSAVPDSAVIAMSGAPALDMKRMKFGKRAYRGDMDYQKIQKLMAKYNSGGGDPKQKFKLLEAAMGYIDKFNTGDQAQHRGRTGRVEDLIYQLTMDDGQKDKAQATANRFRSGFKVKYGSMKDVSKPGRERDKEALLAHRGRMRGTMDKALGTLGDMVSGDKRYSKTMQMAASGVLSQLNENDTFHASGSSGTSREIGKDAYHMTGTASVINANSTLGTSLHEMTHAASGRVYGNTSSLFTISKNADADEMRARRDERLQRMQRIKDLASNTTANKDMAKTVTDAAVSDVANAEEVSYWTRGRHAYATGNKMKTDYIGGEKKKMIKAIKEGRGEDMSEAKDEDLEAMLPEYEGLMAGLGAGDGLTDAQREEMKWNDESFGHMHDAMGDDFLNADTLVEYDSVINQMLSMYESGNKDRGSAFYRNVRAAALRSHVDRNQELLRQKMDPETAKQLMAKKRAPKAETATPASAAKRKRFWPFRKKK